MFTCNSIHNSHSVMDCVHVTSSRDTFVYNSTMNNHIDHTSHTIVRLIPTHELFHKSHVRTNLVMLEQSTTANKHYFHTHKLHTVTSFSLTDTSVILLLLPKYTLFDNDSSVTANVTSIFWNWRLYVYVMHVNLQKSMNIIPCVVWKRLYYVCMQSWK